MYSSTCRAQGVRRVGGWVGGWVGAKGGWVARGSPGGSPARKRACLLPAGRPCAGHARLLGCCLPPSRMDHEAGRARARAWVRLHEGRLHAARHPWLQRTCRSPRSGFQSRLSTFTHMSPDLLTLGCQILVRNTPLGALHVGREGRARVVRSPVRESGAHGARSALGPARTWWESRWVGRASCGTPHPQRACQRGHPFPPAHL
jgi:hypothetical protein